MIDMVEIVALLPDFGVEITGVNLNDDLTAELAAELHAAVEAHGLVVLRRQGLSDDAIIHLSTYFGELRPSSTKGQGITGRGPIRSSID